jgi:hypothetical protein
MDQKQQIVDRLKQANNVLVTVSSNPSVDQLAACIGMTLALNKMGKHATAVFSGTVPSTIEFLQPEKTIETNTDSLRDFIISLDKTKADKLRYKVEDKVVKIFITPYRTSISEKDLEFSQGDFNVDVVLALGVHEQAQLDQAITSHGRILHDATVITVNVKPGPELGGLNWVVPGASSLSELTVDIVDGIDKATVDSQIATAFLTGIVAETKRFSNERTTPDTMSISAELMAAGANQQLVSTKLEEPAPLPPPPQPQPASNDQPSGDATSEEPAEAKSADGTLEITHDDDSKPLSSLEDLSGGEDSDKKKEPPTPKIQIDDQGSLRNIEEMKAGEKKPEDTTDPNQHLGQSRTMLQPPTGSALGANEVTGESYTDPLSLPQPTDAQPGSPSAASASSLGPPPISANISSPTMPYMPPSMTPGSPPPSVVTLQPIDQSQTSTPAPAIQPSPISSGPPTTTAASATTPTPALGEPATPTPTDQSAINEYHHVDNARDAVSQALAAQPNDRPEPIHALNAQPLGDPLHTPPPSPVDNTPPDLNVPVPAESSQPAALNIPTPVGAPPPVPPPMMPTSPQ